MDGRSGMRLSISIWSIVILITSACMSDTSDELPAESASPAQAESDRRRVMVAQPPAGGRLIAYDLETGEEVLSIMDVRIRLASSAIADRDGTVYFGIVRSTGITDVVAVSRSASTSEKIGEVAGQVYIRAMSPTGEHLLLASFAGGADEQPDRIVELPIPEHPRQRVAASATVGRQTDMQGIVVPDGRVWFRLATGDDAPRLIWREFVSDGSPRDGAMEIPSMFAYFSFLMRDDARAMYVVDYRSAVTIHTIDVESRVLQSSVAIRPEGGGTKGISCSAALSNDDASLYVIGLDGQYGGGIDIVDTSTMTRRDNVASEYPIYCIGTAADSDTVYGVAAPVDGQTPVVAIDPETGTEVAVSRIRTADSIAPLFVMEAPLSGLETTAP